MSAVAMKPSEALRAARQRISPAQAWIKGDFARDRQGNSVPWGHYPQATCWCALGAIEAAIGRDDFVERSNLALYLRRVTGYDFIDNWNDDERRTHEQVLDAFDRAAALAESEGR